MKLFSSKNHQSAPSKPEKAGGLFARLGKTRNGLFGGIANLFSGRQLDESIFEELEEQLLMADLGVSVTTRMIDALRTMAKSDALQEPALIVERLRGLLLDILSPCQRQPLSLQDGRPTVVMMVGVNGVGKTTTLAKIARYFLRKNQSVIFGACDTFRAAAIEQLQSWGQRLGVPVIAQSHGADAAAVAFDAYNAAKAREANLLLIDTAGRQHTHGDLVEQLKKVKRVLAKADPQIPDEVWITVDAGNGQNVLSQIEHFHQAMTLTGICITKLDGTAKGGVLIALADRFALPIRYVGVGESAEDLREFDAGEFVDALLPDLAEKA